MWIADLRVVTFSSSTVLRVNRSDALRAAAQAVLAEREPWVSPPPFEDTWSRFERERAGRRWVDQVEVPIESLVPRVAAGGPDEPFASAVAERLAASLEWHGDALPTLDYLRESGFRTALLWDSPVPLPHAWHERSRPWFDEVVGSRELGRRTPDPAAFHEALRRLRVGPHALLHVGEAIVEDVHAAQRVQLRTGLLERFGRSPPDPEAAAWLRRVQGVDASAVKPDLRLRTLEDLPSALDGLA